MIFVYINIDRNFDAQVGMISFKKVNKKNFFRLYFSVKEHDDTSRYIKNFNTNTISCYQLNIITLTLDQCFPSPQKLTESPPPPLKN